MGQLKTHQKNRQALLPKTLAEVTPQYLNRLGIEVVVAATSATHRALRRTSPTTQFFGMLAVTAGTSLIVWGVFNCIAAAQYQEMNAMYEHLRLIP